MKCAYRVEVPRLPTKAGAAEVTTAETTFTAKLRDPWRRDVGDSKAVGVSSHTSVLKYSIIKELTEASYDLSTSLAMIQTSVWLVDTGLVGLLHVYSRHLSR